MHTSRYKRKGCRVDFSDERTTPGDKRSITNVCWVGMSWQHNSNGMTMEWPCLGEIQQIQHHLSPVAIGYICHVGDSSPIFNKSPTLLAPTEPCPSISFLSTPLVDAEPFPLVDIAVISTKSWNTSQYNLTIPITKTSFTQLQLRPLPLVAMQAVVDVEVAPSQFPETGSIPLDLWWHEQITSGIIRNHLDCSCVAWWLVSQCGGGMNDFRHEMQYLAWKINPRLLVLHPKILTHYFCALQGERETQISNPSERFHLWNGSIPIFIYDHMKTTRETGEMAVLWMRS